ncbi:MAG: EamA family transporter [Bryobacteraceae bacterium]
MLSTTGERSLKARTLLLVFLVIFFNALGNLLLAWGMKHVTESVGINPLSYLHAMLNPAVAGGIFLLILWLLTRMALLSWADLSFVLPLTSLGYVLAAVLGKVFLNEAVTPGHWIGTALIFAGTFLVGSTQSKTNEKARAEL